MKKKNDGIHRIFPSDVKLRCKTCEQLYHRNFFARLVSKGCSCGQAFEFIAVTQAEINALFRQAIENIKAEGIDQPKKKNEDLPF